MDVLGDLGRTARRALHTLLRDRRVSLPDDPDLLAQLATVRLRESSPGVARLDHDAGAHDDQAVALGLAALAIIERGEQRGRVLVPRGRISEARRRILTMGHTRRRILRP